MSKKSPLEAFTQFVTTAGWSFINDGYKPSVEEIAALDLESQQHRNAAAAIWKTSDPDRADVVKQLQDLHSRFTKLLRLAHFGHNLVESWDSLCEQITNVEVIGIPSYAVIQQAEALDVLPISVSPMPAAASTGVKRAKKGQAPAESEQLEAMLPPHEVRDVGTHERLDKLIELLPGSIAPTPPIHPIRIEGHSVFVNNAPVVFDMGESMIEDAITWLSELLTKPGTWFSDSDVGRSRNLEGVRLDKMRKHLPEAIKDYVETRHGVGSRVHWEKVVR